MKQNLGEKILGKIKIIVQYYVAIKTDISTRLFSLSMENEQADAGRDG